jgi:peptide/nickel transport system permease protein
MAQPLTSDSLPLAESGSAWAAPERFSVLRRLLQNRLAVGALVTIALVVAFCYIGPLIWTVSPDATDPLALLSPPSSAHPLGTDNVGRDVLARMMAGGQISLQVGIAAALLGTIIGVLYGAISGYAGGFVDAALMRVVDAVLSIPVLVLLILLAAEIRPNEVLMILVIGFTAWLVPARLIRAETLSLKHREFVLASRLMGSRSSRTIMRHIVPNSVGTIVVNATFQVADAILLIAYLSFLGLGIPPPAPTWGGILADGINYLYENAWWLIYPPGLAILLVVVAFNYLGDALRDAFDLRFRRDR